MVGSIPRSSFTCASTLRVHPSVDVSQVWVSD